MAGIPSTAPVSRTLNCRGRLLTLDKPLVMGILNVTPDSFFDGGKYNEPTAVADKVNSLLSEGAHIIDLGGMSTRPGAAIIEEEVELDRVLPALHVICENFPEAIISIDTIRSSVAEKALQAGAHIVNDISGGKYDSGIWRVAAQYNAPYILMHMLGTPETMQQRPEYENVVESVLDFFIAQAGRARAAGVHDIILDPGFGFGKTVEHNYALLRQLGDFALLGYPIMAGISRKSMVNRPLGIQPDKALNGTSVVNTIALMNGASLLRVHDVREAVEAVKLFQTYQEAGVGEE